MDNPLPDELRVIVEDLQRYLAWEAEQGKISILSPASAPPALVKPATDRSLEAIRQELGDCKRCKLSNGRTQIVFGVGNPKAELVFVGEGPGAEEDAQGVPFVGGVRALLEGPACGDSASSHRRARTLRGADAPPRQNPDYPPARNVARA